MTPQVYLVGAGPGDPKLLTVKAVEVISRADAIIYDALVDHSILQYASPQAQLIYVGKRAGKHSNSQEEINRIIIQTAYEVGGTIVRLKGGDPFVFGRGGEEMIALHQEGIAYEIVPGITSGIASPAYCGIPVTHREVSRMVTLITGTTKNGLLSDDDWESIARMGHTLIFYMSMRSIPEICKKLQQFGVSGSRPAAIISHGTMSSQQILMGTLSHWETEPIDCERLSPGLFVVGDVVSFAETYNWREAKPLAGQKIVVTRSLYQSSSLLELLQENGAETILLPTIEIKPVSDLSLLDVALDNISTYDWIVFPSANAVEIFFDRCLAKRIDARKLSTCKVGAVGEVTAQKLRTYGIIADFIPKQHTGKAFATEIIQQYPSIRQGKVFIPSSSIAHTDIRDILTHSGSDCSSIAVYDNHMISYEVEYLNQLLSQKIDWLTFCSSSAVEHFMQLVARHHLEHLLQGIQIAVIGEITAQTLQKYHLHHTAMPEQPNIRAMVDAIIQQSH